MRLRQFVSPFLPFTFAAAGLYPALGLRSPITAWPTGETAYFLGFLLLSLLWLMFELMFVMRRSTSIDDLSLDCLMQTIVSIIFAGIGGYYLAGGVLFGQNSLEWWFAIPMFVAIFDAIVSNAWVVYAAKQITDDARRYAANKSEGAAGLSEKRGAS